MAIPGGEANVRWMMPEVPQEQAAMLAAELGLHPLPARVLVHRGLRTRLVSGIAGLGQGGASTRFL